jgi:microcystin-dependent protein
MTDSVAADGQTPMTGPLMAFSGASNAPGVTFVGATTSGFFNAGGGEIGASVSGVQVATLTSSGWGTASGAVNTVPIGTVVDFAGSTAPAGWQLCYGQTLTIASFPALFAILGITYGGDGVTTFGLPDCRGRTGFGKDNMGGVAAGRITAAGGNYDGTILGGTGGQQNHAIAKANLPSYNLNVDIPANQWSHNHTASYQAAVTPGTPFQGGSNSGGPGVLSLTTSSVNNPDLSGTAATGGSGTALPVLSNAITFNKIIFAGA